MTVRDLLAELTDDGTPRGADEVWRAAQRRVRARRSTRRLAGVATAASLVAVIVFAVTGRTDRGPTRPSSRHNAATCGDSGVAAGSVWPITGVARTSSWSALPDLAAHFIAAEIGLSPGAARVERRRYDCLVHVETGGLSALVEIAGSPGGYRINGLNYPDPQPDIGGSVAVRGRTIDLHTPSCPGCTAVLKIRYPNVAAEATSSDGGFHIDLGKRPLGPGTLVTVVRNKEGTVVRANGSTLPAGNFAAG